MVQDLVHNLCEPLVENIGGVAGIGKKTPPPPITYLTQWKIVGNSEVHTLPYPDGVVLPTGYRRCKYLEFHGTEYLNTGIKTNNGIGMSLTFSTTAIYTAIIGARVTASDNTFVLGMFAPDGKFNIGYGDYGQRIDAPVNVLDGQLHTFTLSNTQCTLDNINVSINFGTFSTPNANDIYIGTWNNSGRLDNRIYEGKIYSVRLYDSNGNLFNGIPCLDDNDVPCLYDTVSGTSFYNDGTGTFGYEIEPQPTEIWSCGEYSAVDGKWHILVQPLGGSIADIALTEPLRKTNDVADTIEFPSNTDGKALVTRPFGSTDMGKLSYRTVQIGTTGYYRVVSYNLINVIKKQPSYYSAPNFLTPIYAAISAGAVANRTTGLGVNANGDVLIYDPDYDQADSATAFKAHVDGVELIYELATPTTELVDAPQIEEADSYSMVISQGAKAVSWSSFETN